MHLRLDSEKCPPIISSEFTPWSGRTAFVSEPRAPLSITISRKSGSGAHLVAKLMADYLNRVSPNPSPPWTVFDRNLAERVLEDHHLPPRLARFMPEDRTSELADVLDELLRVRRAFLTFS
jgi:hypothetical protein